MSLPDNATLRVVQQVLEVLAGGERAGLITDVDGTLSPTVARPEDAEVLPLARRALSGLRDVLSLVAVVSGRRAADARRMVGVDGLTYVGNHGLEVWSDAGPRLVPEAEAWVPRVASVLDDLARHCPEPGVLFENKGASASLHYRLTPDPARTRHQLLDLLSRSAVSRGVRIEEGRMVLNLLPPLAVSKGSAVAALVQQHSLRRIVYLGDDVTDTHAFEALAGLRHAGQAHALNVAVEGPETPLSVRELADASLPSVEAVADVLWRVLKQLDPSASIEGRAPFAGDRHG